MPFLQLTLHNTRPLDVRASKGDAALRKVANLLQGYIAGTRRGDGWELLNDNTPQVTTTAAGQMARAGAVGLFATGTGAETAIINGTSVAVTWATSDANTVALMVTAINANTTVNPFVMATRYIGKIALGTCIAGTCIEVCGFKFVATTGATGKPGGFNISGTDAQDSTALAAAINSMPGLSSKVVAVPDGTSAVYVGLVENRVARSSEKLAAYILTTGLAVTTVTLTQILATGAFYMVVARTPGLLGNCCTFTVTGTNHSAISAVSGKLGGGLGGYLSTGQYLSSDTR